MWRRAQGTPRCPGRQGDKRFGKKISPLIDDDQRDLTGGAHSVSNHHGVSILAVLDDSIRQGNLGAPDPVVLMIVGLFDGE